MEKRFFFSCEHCFQHKKKKNQKLTFIFFISFFFPNDFEISQKHLTCRSEIKQQIHLFLDTKYNLDGCGVCKKF